MGSEEPRGVAGKAPHIGRDSPGALRRWTVVVVGASVVAVVAFWAGRLTLTPPAELPEATDDQIAVMVSEQTIGQTLEYGARTSRPTRPIATNALPGVVTAAPVAAVTDREVGDVLYAVSGVPVRIVEGDTPFYRDLTPGLVGDDVAQLEGALVALGHLDVADTVFDSATTEAVSAWQRKLGTPATGAVSLGELVAAPILPASVVVDEEVIWLGAVLGGGETVVSMATGEPQFVLPLSPGQLSLVPPDAPMTVEGFGKRWPAVWESSAPNEELGMGELVRLASPEGGSVCAEECAVVPAEESWVSVQIEVVPRTTGPAVPVSAVTTDAAGQAWVTIVDDHRTEQRPVTVERTHAGLAVVKGVAVGEMVQALASGAEESRGLPSPTPSSSGPP